MQALEWDELQYCENENARGRAWIRWYFAGQYDLEDIIERSEWFWKWWINVSEQANEIFLQRLELMPALASRPAECRELYQDIQQKHTRHKVPNSIVIQDINKAIRQSNTTPK